MCSQDKGFYSPNFISGLSSLNTSISVALHVFTCRDRCRQLSAWAINYYSWAAASFLFVSWCPQRLTVRLVNCQCNFFCVVYVLMCQKVSICCSNNCSFEVLALQKKVGVHKWQDICHLVPLHLPFAFPLVLLNYIGWANGWQKPNKCIGNTCSEDIVLGWFYGRWGSERRRRHISGNNLWQQHITNE